MADRNSAEIYGSVFKMLAEHPSDEHKIMARRLMRETQGYDFNAYQMDCDEALLKLGVAKPGPADQDFPILYYIEDYE